MSTHSQRKGIAGEQELINLLKDQLGEDLKRNLDQVRDGGADVLGLPGWAVEVKRAKTAKISEWWSQTITQAQEVNEKPVLAIALIVNNGGSWWRSGMNYKGLRRSRSRWNGRLSCDWIPYESIFR